MFSTVHALFNHPVARRVFLWLRYPISLGVIAGVALSARLDLFWLALAVSAVGEAIQIWSFASLVKNEQLTARGPYVMVRNPMYLGRYFLILGFLLLPGKIWIPVVYTVLYYFYMVNRVAREEKRLGEILGQPYHDYCSRTARFLPAFSQLADPAVRFFDVGVLTRNNGHWNLLSAVAAYAVLYIYLFLIR